MAASPPQQHASTSTSNPSPSSRPRPSFRLSIPLSTLRPSYSAEDVPLNLGMDEDESSSPLLSAVSPNPPSASWGRGPMEGRDAWARFSLGWEDEDAESVVGEQGDFDCHICLRTATNPCVTRCGHLFCYDDLEQWLRIHPRCPVCSAFISLQHDVVKIFGRGRSSRRASASSSGSTELSISHHGGTVKKRPPAPGSAAPSLPSPPATPSPQQPPVSLPSITEPRTSLPSARPQETLEEKHPALVQPPHPLLVEQLLTHQFARILSLVALVFFLLLIGLQRS